MYGVDLARSEVRDLRDAGELFRRGQVSLGILRIRFDRSAARLRLIAPEAAGELRGWLAELEAIGSDERSRVVRVLDAFERWSEGPLVPAPAPETIAAPSPPPAPRGLITLVPSEPEALDPGSHDSDTGSSPD